jgi:hypothetical protein
VLDLIKNRIEYENSLSIEEYFLLKKNRINWKALSSNEDVVELLKDRIEYEKNTPEYTRKYEENRIDWAALSLNRNANELLKARIEYEKGLSDEEYEKLEDNKLDWTYISGNQCAIELLKANPEKIVWENLSYNENAIDLLKANIDKVVWDDDYYYLFEDIFINNLSELVELFKEKIEYEKNISDEKYKKIDWKRLCYTQNAVEIFKAYPAKIVWKYLSKNKDPAVIELLRDRFEYEKQLKELNIEEYENLEDKYKIHKSFPNHFHFYQK